MCPLKAETFWRIFCCNPMPVATETIIMIIPIAIAAIAILIIGAEILLLWSLAVINLLAIKYSKFNLKCIFNYIASPVSGARVKNTVLDTIFKYFANLILSDNCNYDSQSPYKTPSFNTWRN